MGGTLAGITKQAFISSLLGLALVLAALGCAASAPPLAPSTSTPVPQPTATAFDSSPPLAPVTKSPAADVAVGTDVGDRIPDFAINLSSGATVSLNDLMNEQRPTFLFFFATW